MDAQALALGSGGGAAFFFVGLKLWSMFSETKNATKRDDLGSAYESHMYQRLKTLEEREEVTNKRLLEQTETIGALRAEVASLKDKLAQAEASYRESKSLLAQVTDAYETMKSENEAMKKMLHRYDQRQGVRETGREGRPWSSEDKG